MANIKNAVNKNPEVIRPVDDPYSKTGGLAVLKGNLAPDGGVVKRSAVAPEMLVHEGPARVFECEDDAFTFTCVDRPAEPVPVALIAILAGICLVVVFVLIIGIHGRKKKKKAARTA